MHSSDEEEDTTANTTPEPSSAGITTNDEKVAFNGMSALKSQWESGQLANTRSESDTVKSELAELRSKNKSAEPLKQVYERAVQEAKSSENLTRSDSITLENQVKAVAIKEKFEKGTVEIETEEDPSERARKEREEEINRLTKSETITKEARNKFKQIEANMDKDAPVVNGQHGKIDDVSINPDEMQQRFKYFENLKDNQVVKEPVKDEAEDIPKVETTKKMLSKFKALESGQGEKGNDKVDAPAPRTPKRITPPKEVGKVYESEPIADPNIGKCMWFCARVIIIVC